MTQTSPCLLLSSGECQNPYSHTCTLPVILNGLVTDATPVPVYDKKLNRKERRLAARGKP